MKTMQWIVAACLLGCQLQAQAQDKIRQAMSSLEAMREFVSTQSSTDKNPTTLKVENQVTIITFALPPKRAAWLNKAREAFAADEPKAYNVITKEAEGTPYALFDQLVMGCDYPQLLINCFADPADSTRRYAYGLEWSTAKGDSVRGRMVCHYGLTPKARKAEAKRGYIFNLDDFANSNFVFSDSLRRLFTDSLNAYALQLDSLRGMSLADAESLKGFFDNWHQTKAVKKMTAEAWLEQFNANAQPLRKNFRRSYSTRYATTLYMLCKNHPSVLTYDEKAIAASELHNLKELSLNNMCSNLINAALKQLRF